MTIKEWLSLKENDTIFGYKSGRKRKIIKVHYNPKSRCITLESGAMYCGGERYLFEKKKPLTLNQ